MKKVLIAGMVACVAFGVSLRSEAKINKFASITPEIYRGSQPETQADYEMLKRFGIKTLLDLRKDSTVETERAMAAQAGLSFVNVPIDGFWGAGDPVLDQAVAVIADPAAQPVFVHCQLGQDRTGAVLGLWRVFHEHWTPADAYHEMRDYGYDFLLLGLDYSFWHRLKDAGYVEQELAAVRAQQ